MTKFAQEDKDMDFDKWREAFEAGSKSEIQEVTDRIERLEDYARFDANCPCCDGTEACGDGCTFAEDCPNDVPRMEAARYALGGGN
jgi:hypothetical protein